jgi:hypothetical protein
VACSPWHSSDSAAGVALVIASAGKSSFADLYSPVVAVEVAGLVDRAEVAAYELVAYGV